jgi:hypothetical protein
VRPLQDLVHIGGGTSVIRRTAQPIEQEGTFLDPLSPIGGHHRQPLLGRDGQDPVAVRIEQGKGWHEQGLGMCARHGCQDGVHLAGTVHLQQLELEPQGLRRPRDLADDGSRHGMGRVQEDGHAGDPRHRVLEQLALLPNERRARAGDPRDIPAGPRQAADESRPNRIRQGDHDDGHRRRRLLGCSGCGSPCRDEDLDGEAHELGRQRGEPLVLPLGIAELQDEIIPLHIAEGAQRLPEDLEIGIGAAAPARESTNAMHVRGWLCVGRAWDDEETHDQHDEERQRGHRITSSAWKSRLGGTVRPSAWAVLRLITSSNFIACSTGKSAGVAPFRSLST